MSYQQPPPPPPPYYPPPGGQPPHTTQPPKYESDLLNTGVAGGRGYYQATGGPGPSAGTTTIIIREFGPYPSSIECPFCRCHVLTSVSYTPGCLAWLSGSLLCLFGLWPCACIPCCINDCQDARHFCPHCGQYLGTYARI
ncbi:hypothetical protein BOX15_Mlig009274g1 [Macrostomum lignano]|uniref:LITAF domain-containing protein n=1 Tax=Macrostomum lignano TaxID=282301 RepID=A0A267G1K0_9PLAT|nr:hypothetical protein BOX15_Mlig009274g1 [Macrostomum lignano]